MTRRMSWYWVLPGAVGIALVMAVVLLLLTTTAGKTPTASAQGGTCTLVLTKELYAAAFVSEGGSIVWMLTVQNTGDEACTNVEVTDDLDPLTNCIETSPADVGCPGAGATVIWDLAEGLDAGGSATLDITVGLTAGAVDGDIIYNHASASADNGDPTASETVSVEVVNDCHLTITKDANHSVVEPGDDITYTITVTNNADERGAGCADLRIEDELPSDLECVSASVSDANGLGYDVNGCSADDVVWAFDDVLPGGGDYVVLNLRVRTDEDLDDGDHVTNKACVTGAAGVTFATVDAVEDPAGICSSKTTRIEKEREPAATPQPTATRTPIPPLPTNTPLPPPPQGTLAPPRTGTGSASDGSPWLAVGLGLGGVCLLLVSGAALAKKRIR